MRADRLLSILMLLQTRRAVTARELAERLEVSVRTIHRDMEALAVAGVPVYAERGTGGGWRLPDGYRTDLTGMTGAEALSLFLPGSAGQLAALGLSEASEAARRKLLASLPEPSRRAAEFARSRLHIDGAGWYGREEAAPLLRPLQEAVWAERKIRLAYGRADDGVVERVIDPLGLVAAGTVWYFVGAVDGEPRSYRVSRAVAVELLDEPAVRPDRFELAAYWERSKRDFLARVPRYPAVLEADPAAMARLRRAPYLDVAAEERTADGRVRAAVLYQSLESACELLLGLGPLVRVLEPEALRKRVALWAAETAALYRQDG